VRQRWEESDGPASAPERGGRTWAAVLLSPRSGAGKRRPPATHGSAPWATVWRPTGSARCLVCRQFLRAPRRFSFSCDPARRAKDSSPVRQHWERDGPASAPERGGRTRAAVLLSPRSGAGKRRPPATHGSAPWATIFRPSGSARCLFCGILQVFAAPAAYCSAGARVTFRVFTKRSWRSPITPASPFANWAAILSRETRRSS
jgi:hypothetical protein